MARYYLDPSIVPDGRRLRTTLNCPSAKMAELAVERVAGLSGDGQIGVYADGPCGPFQGYAIKTDGRTFFEEAREP